MSVTQRLFPITAFHLGSTYVVMQILVGVILTQKISMSKKLYLLQWKDCQNYHNYRRRKEISFVSVRTSLQVGFNENFVIYHACHLNTIYLSLCGTVKLFFLFIYFFWWGGGVGVNYSIPSGHIIVIVMWTYLNLKKRFFIKY